MRRQKTRPKTTTDLGDLPTALATFKKCPKIATSKKVSKLSRRERSRFECPKASIECEKVSSRHPTSDTNFSRRMEWKCARKILTKCEPFQCKKFYWELALTRSDTAFRARMRAESQRRASLQRRARSLPCWGCARSLRSLRWRSEDGAPQGKAADALR